MQAVGRVSVAPSTSTLTTETVDTTDPHGSIQQESSDLPQGESKVTTPGVDGVVLSACGRRATFLPQVWEQLPDPADFLARLRRKAGLPADYWGRDVVVETYTVTAWQEAAPGVVPDEPRGRRP